jgi:hypothetical protein
LVTRKHKRWIPILDQGSLGSCTGNAGVGATGSTPFYETLQHLNTDWTEATAVKLYSDATIVDGFDGVYPPEDTGSSGLAIAKVLKSRGWISGYQHTFTFTDMQAALQNGPVLIGINWYNNFFDPDSDGVISIAQTDEVAGGHEVVVDEIDMEKQRFGFTNSWGTGWGVGGRAYIPFALMQRLLKEDGDVTVLVPLSQPAPEPTPEPYNVDKVLWDDVSSWAAARHTGCNRKAAKSVTAWAQAKGLTT